MTVVDKVGKGRQRPKVRTYVNRIPKQRLQQIFWEEATLLGCHN